MFRWTPRTGDAKTIVPIEVDDENLPAGLSGSAARSTYAAARDAWRNALGTSTLDTSTRFLSTDGPYPSNRFVLRVKFVDVLPGKLGDAGFTVLGNRVQTLEVRVARRNPLNNSLLPEAQFRQALTHELGHSLGLVGFTSAFSGHSPSAIDIMYPESAPTAPNLTSDRDRLTIRDLYARAPQVTRRED
jgi:hypothetical protein